MKFSHETLMAYADGELDADTRREIEAAMATDAEVAAQVARHQAMRVELGAAFSGILEEQVPSRLIDAARVSPVATADKVADLAAARAARTQSTQKRRWSWPEWTSIAASLLIGILAGRSALQDGDSNLVATAEEGLVASGALAAALTSQPGSAQASDSEVDIGLSFRAKFGEYCRTFTSSTEGALAGFACREADGWHVRALVQGEPGAAGAEYRMAGTQLPPVILQAIEDTIEGDALDAQEEAAARERGWRR